MRAQKVSLNDLGPSQNWFVARLKAVAVPLNRKALGIVMRISAYLIVKNEEDCLAACLESVQNVVDEIVVADTGSTDGTVDLARRYTPNVLHFEWIDDFAAARNFAIKHATGDYLLHIDADDVLCDPGSARARLEAFMQANTDPNVVGAVEIESVVGDGPDAQHAVEVAHRFFRRGAFRYEGPIHEQLTPITGQKRAAATGLRYIHSGYQYGAASAKNKSQRNKEILRRVLERSPQDEYYLYQLGKAHFGLKEYPEAIDAFERALEQIQFANQTLPRGASGVYVAEPVLSELLCSLAYAYVNTGALAKAQALLERHAAMDHGGARTPDFHHALGYVYLMLGDIARAKAGYTESLRLGAAHERVLGTGSYSSEYHLGLLAEAEQDLNGAIEHYCRSLALKPDYTITLNRCVDFVLEYHIALPSRLWVCADQQAFARVYRGKLVETLRAGGANAAMELVNAARGLAPELYQNCVAWLREFVRASP
ncbi:MAG: glycosyltransferase [Candidatus Hydrogenedentes bacterium]|nr:glycosyltransferase [Candidatus Hydrogenedentota bacterium]